jgi:hypothetical protein
VLLGKLLRKHYGRQEASGTPQMTAFSADLTAAHTIIFSRQTRGTRKLFKLTAERSG